VSVLVVRGGTVVVPGTPPFRADVAAESGRVQAIGLNLPKGDSEIDANGLHVFPGIVDPHVHFGNTIPFADDVAGDTGAALIGGITTAGVFLRSLDSYLASLPTFRSAIDDGSWIDVFFHLQIFTDEQIREMEEYSSNFGITSFKFYMSGIPGIVPYVNNGTLLQGLRAAAALSQRSVVAVHCEDAALIDSARADLARDPGAGRLADWERAHPDLAEVVAIETAVRLAAEARVRLYVVHVSSAAGLSSVRRLLAMGYDFVAETTSPYLCLSSDDSNELLLKMVPPIRSKSNGEALWQGVRDRVISTIGTDNTPRTRASKKPDADLLTAMSGYPMLPVHLPALLHYGVHERRVPLETLVDCICRKPAETFGLYPRKGTVQIGSDADMVIVDLTETRVVDPGELNTIWDFSPFEHKRLYGWPRYTIKNGELVAAHGRIVGERSGRYIARPLDTRPEPIPGVTRAR
jgi:dihydropyrimidinase